MQFVNMRNHVLVTQIVSFRNIDALFYTCPSIVLGQTQQRKSAALFFFFQCSALIEKGMLLHTVIYVKY
jgi:hypothetical protein